MSKISGPPMDCIDIQMDVPAVPYKELSNARHAESSETIRNPVVTARNVQLRRFFGEHGNRSHEARLLGRGYDRILKRNSRCADSAYKPGTSPFRTQLSRGEWDNHLSGLLGGGAWAAASEELRPMQD